MAIFGRSPPVCANRKHCILWISTYMNYCVCSLKDGVSLTLGLVSVASWTVAEVPQIMTNYKQKSAEGLSAAFLTTWLFGDLFNLAGCLLEPAVLPTQVYMAILYLITTSILALQSIYYNRIYHHWKANKHKDHKLQQPVTGSIRNSTPNGSKALQGAVLPSSPIPVAAPVLPRYHFCGKETYYMSARSLSKGYTPPTGLHLAQSQCPRSHDRIPISVNDLHFIEEPLLGRSAPPPSIKNTLCMVSVITYLLGSFSIHLSVDKRINLEEPSQGVVIQVGRKLLQNSSMSLLNDAGGSSGIGTFLGWAMSAIYMGGRLPQICLNIRRGNVEGLNPLMFFFALVGNLTYVASILVNSTDPSMIKPNLPWLVDAGGCALLDTLILIQFIYFNNWKSQDQQNC